MALASPCAGASQSSGRSPGCAFARHGSARPAPGPAQSLDDALIHSTVESAADLIDREYFDPAAAAAIAASLRQRLTAGRYSGPMPPAAFARMLTGDLASLSHDRHLVVTATDANPRGGYAGPGASPDSREQAARESNAGVAEVQMLTGDIGYVKITSFFPPEQARAAMAGAMQTLQNAAALIVDLRDNDGGSPETVALLASYFFEGPEIPLFDIIPRHGEPLHYGTQADLAGSDGRPPVFVLIFLADLVGRRSAAIYPAGTPSRRNRGGNQQGRGEPRQALSDQFPVHDHDSQRAISQRCSRLNWEGVGVLPDTNASASDALRVSTVLALRQLLSDTPAGPRYNLLRNELAKFSMPGASPFQSTAAIGSRAGSGKSRASVNIWPLRTRESNEKRTTIMKAIQVSKTGGPEVLTMVDLPIPQPKPNEVVVKIAAAGVNFIDIYIREGRYPSPLPFVFGQEAAGVVHEAGAEVKSFKPGDRVAYTSVRGAYAEYAAVPASQLVRVPEGVTDQQAAAALLQGMTAHYLSHSTYPLRQGDIALIHAAAGGTGLLLVQMAKSLGAVVIGTVGSEEKAKLVKEHGADHVILYHQQDFEAETKRITNGAGVHVVYDGVGQTTFEKGLNVLRPRGYMVLFGASSGPVPAFDPIALSQKGSLFLTRPSLHHYTATHEELEQRAADVLGDIAKGKLKLRIPHTYPLSEAAQAHRELALAADHRQAAVAHRKCLRARREPAAESVSRRSVATADVAARDSRSLRVTIPSSFSSPRIGGAGGDQQQELLVFAGKQPLRLHQIGIGRDAADLAIHQRAHGGGLPLGARHPAQVSAWESRPTTRPWS